tara:strand:- start:5134 stop:6723 length:1590 start_codon:yes stop_codon:yes gene_type:complete
MKLYNFASIKNLFKAIIFVSGLCLISSLASAADKTFIYGYVGTPASFDTDNWQTGMLESTVNVYENLTKHKIVKDKTGREVFDAATVEPHMADSWTSSEGGKVMTFTVRKGIKSPFGNELSAKDVAYSWNMARERKRTGNFMIKVGRVEKVEAISDYKVKFTLSTSNDIFPRILTTVFPALIDSKHVKQFATADDKWAKEWMAKNTAGFGPYHLKSVRPGEGAVFELNKNYFDKKPYFERVMFREIPSAASRAALVKSGKIHWAEQMPIQQLVDLIKDPNVKVDSVPGTGAATLRMNRAYPPFDDIRVRKAIIHAMDYEAIGTAVFRNLGERADSILSPAFGEYYIPAHDYKTDFAKAKALLSEAGHGNGLDVTLEYSENWWWEEPLSIQAKDSLAKVGINVTLKRIPKSEMNSRRRAGKRNLPFFPHLANAFVLSPNYAFYLSAHKDGSSNVNAYYSEKFDKLVDDAISTQSQSERLRLVHEAQRVHAEDATFVITHYPKSYSVTVPCIKGWVWYQHDRLVWKHLRCE